MPTISDHAYARKQLQGARRRRQIADFTELDRGVFVIQFVDHDREWPMTTSMAIAFAKGLRVGHAHARNEVFA